MWCCGTACRLRCHHKCSAALTISSGSGSPGSGSGGAVGSTAGHSGSPLAAGTSPPSTITSDSPAAAAAADARSMSGAPTHLPSSCQSVTFGGGLLRLLQVTRERPLEQRKIFGVSRWMMLRRRWVTSQRLELHVIIIIIIIRQLFIRYSNMARVTTRVPYVRYSYSGNS